jgi:hypothetical protein
MGSFGFPRRGGPTQGHRTRASDPSRGGVLPGRWVAAESCPSVGSDRCASITARIGVGGAGGHRAQREEPLDEFVLLFERCEGSKRGSRRAWDQPRARLCPREGEETLIVRVHGWGHTMPANLADVPGRWAIVGADSMGVMCPRASSPYRPTRRPASPSLVVGAR